MKFIEVTDAEYLSKAVSNQPLLGEHFIAAFKKQFGPLPKKLLQDKTLLFYDNTTQIIALSLSS